jgi:CHASE2 domain-containing sensor protein
MTNPEMILFAVFWGITVAVNAWFIKTGTLTALAAAIYMMGLAGSFTVLTILKGVIVP